jgi:Gametolysin peptidase M11/NPCBM-associated, NEW3 domain of alpha-galactosidase
MRERGTLMSSGNGWWTAVVSAVVLVCGLTMPSVASAQGRPDVLPGVGPVVLEGELEVSYEDSATSARLLHFLHTDNRRVPLSFQDGTAPDLMTGSRVRVRGDLKDGAVTTTTSGVSVLAASTSRTMGTQSVLIILFNFSNDARQPWAASTISSVNDQVKNYYLENTFGQTTMSFTVVGWYTIAATNSGCDYTTWGSQAEAQATNAGVNISSYNRIVVVFPSASGCGWTGAGNVGGPRSWINGSYALRTIAHEQGHNFGNYHSKANKCDSTTCTTVEYGDDRDIMGASGVVGHMNAFQKERLGWLNYGTSPIVQNVTATGQYWIDAYETTLGNTKALKIWNAAANGYYYVELRNKVGFDGSLTPGVTLHSGVSGISYQIDLDAATSTFDSTLDVGQVFTDSAMGLSIQTLSVSTTGAAIGVTLTAPPCTTRLPAVSLTASSALSYTAKVTNANDSTCPASPFSFAALVPAGWLATFGTPSVASLSPGATASSSMTLSAPAGTAGTFPFTVTGTDGGPAGQTASVTGSVTLVTSLTVMASASASGSGSNRSASIFVTTKAGTQAAAGAAVTVVITSPKGVKTTLNATAGADGTVTVKFSLKPKDPSGTYQVQVTANGNGGTGTAATTFVAP